jgi:hypothetical protein
MPVLIKELNEHINSDIIVEAAADGKKNYYIEGIFMQTEAKNRNGRIYPKHILENELARYGKNISEKRALGELGHPDTPTINLDKVSHLITNLRFEGNDIYGRAKILDTPNGKIAKSFIDEGVRLGVSSRGMGSIKSVDGANIVQGDFKLATVDIVADPSAHNAFVEGIMENHNWRFDETHGWVQDYFEEAKSLVSQASRNEIESVSLRIFENFMKKL